MTIDLNRSKLALKHYEPAHPDSDISVTFPEADILYCADTYCNGIYRFIDYSAGGNIDGMIKATDANVGAVTAKTIVIPGHGPPLSNKQEWTEYRVMLVAIRDNVRKLKQQGGRLRTRSRRSRPPLSTQSGASSLSARNSSRGLSTGGVWRRLATF